MSTTTTTTYDHSIHTYITSLSVSTTTTTTYDHSIHTYITSLSVSASRLKTATVWAYNQMRGGLWLAGWCWVPTAAVSVFQSERETERDLASVHGVPNTAPASKRTYGHNFWHWRRTRVGLISKLCSFLRAVQRYQLRRDSFSSFFFAYVEVSVMHAAKPSTWVHLFTQ